MWAKEGSHRVNNAVDKTIALVVTFVTEYILGSGSNEYRIFTPVFY